MFHNRHHLPSYPPQHPYRMPAHNKSASETRKAIDHYSYALNEEIGRGFSSRVYRGRDENTQELVAVKVIDMKMVKQSIHAVLLKNEINALKQFNCNTIMKLHDVFQTQNNTYIITEYCDSGDLNNHIRKKGRIEEAEAVRILQQVVLALYEMNKKGFIHRDIKPANILIDKGSPKIADFGFAVPQAEAKLQGKNFNVGTPLYMSPQALRQQGHTEKGDVWAIGVMFFEMLYGRTPYTASSEAALISNILHSPLHIPSTPQISDQCKDFIRKCLQVDENKRARVKDIASHTIVSSRSQTPMERVIQHPLKDITNKTQPDQIQKFKRSQSQGVKEVNQKDYKSQLQYEQKKKEHEANKRKLQQQVQRSASQQNTLQPKPVFKTSAFDEQQGQAQQLPPQQVAGQVITKQKTISIEFKQNNEVLFSQINFCRFLYKFSQSLANSKIIPNEVRDKMLFMMGKNIAIKIQKLTSVLEKENRSNNIFQLEDFDNYKKSESYTRFSQAISEYTDKYMRHYERILRLSQKSEFNKDPIIGSLCNNDLVESEGFYLIAQAYLRIGLNEIKQTFKSMNVGNLSLDQVLPDEYQMSGFILQGLYGYSQLIQKTMEYMNDYRAFQRISQPELLIEKKPDNITYGQLEQIMVSIQ